VAFFSVRHFVGAGWPIHHADPLLVSCAALLFLIAYAFKAWGWQRLFQVSERPTADALAFAGGAACVGGIALPGRVDDAVRIAIVKRYPGTKASIGTLGLSLLVLGMLDNAALTPMASVAAAGSSHWTTRAGFAVVAAAGVAAAAVVAFLPQLARLPFVTRRRFGRWLRGGSRLTGRGCHSGPAGDEILLPHQHEGEDCACEEDEGGDQQDRVQSADKRRVRERLGSWPEWRGYGVECLLRGARGDR